MGVIHAYKMSRSRGYSKGTEWCCNRDTVTTLSSRKVQKPNYHRTSEMQKLVTFALMVNFTLMTVCFHVAILIGGLLTMVFKELPV